MKTNSKNSFIVAAAVLGALVFLLFRKRSHESESANTVPLAPSKTELISGPASLPTKLPEPSAAIVQAKKKFGQEILLGIKTIYPSVKDGQLHFQIRTKTDGSGCQVGDFDQFKSLAKSGEEKMFLLTLERMEKKGQVFKAVKMSLSDITEGKPVPVQIPMAKDFDYYGIFLCSFQKDAKQCSQKAITSPKEWRQVSRGKRVLDRNLHFQMVSVKGDRMLLMPSHKWDRETLSKVQRSVTGEGANLNSSFSLMRSYMEKLASLGASVVGPTVELNLPYRGYHCN